MTDNSDSRRNSPSGHAQILRFRKTSPATDASDPRAGDAADPLVAEHAPAAIDAVAIGAGPNLSGAELLTILWEALADILGTAATAALLRRAARRAQPRWPELAALSITREGFEYHYAVPRSWEDPADVPPRALCELARELWPLLFELTGSIVVNRLRQIPELRDRGIVPDRDTP